MIWLIGFNAGILIIIAATIYRIFERICSIETQASRINFHLQGLKDQLEKPLYLENQEK